jgi:chaperonin GroES|tara:strand:+ start:554 stop:865 length:312 start_codon:yes stop_codon:yes gene_type:complete
MNLDPTFDRIIVEPDDRSDLTVSGLYIPEAHNPAQFKGTVIAIGPGKHDQNGDRIRMSMKIGDRVLYPRSGIVKYIEESSLVGVEGKEYDIMQETNVLIVLRD